MAATNQQVQSFVDVRIRPHSEAIRAIYLALKDDRGAIDDVYAACVLQSPTWSDNRTDGPPHLLGPSDVLSWNAFAAAFTTFIEGNGDYATVLKGCVRPVSG